MSLRTPRDLTEGVLIKGRLNRVNIQQKGLLNVKLF